MGLLSALVLLPVAGPMKGSLWIARQVAEAVERERNDPAALRAALDEAERRLEAGEIDEDTYDAIEDDLLARMRAAP